MSKNNNNYDPDSNKQLLLKKLKKTNNFWPHIKRLFGSPKNFLLSVVLIIIPSIIFVAALVDYGHTEIYKMVKEKPADQRKPVFFTECFKAKEKKCAQGVNPFEQGLRPAQEKRLEFYPHIDLLREFEPYYYFIYFFMIIGGIGRIGNPRPAAPPPVAKNKNKLPLQNELLPPPPQTIEEINNYLLFGGAVPRQWNPDPGRFVMKRNEPEPYFLSSKILQTGLLIIAPPGSGKTGSVFRPLIGFIRRTGNTAIFWDSKGQDFDPDLFDYNFDLENPGQSIKINLYSGETPAQAGERLGEALIPNLSEEKRYFSDVAKDAMSALVAAHFELFDCYPQLTDLLTYLAEPDTLDNLYIEIANPKRKNVKETADQLVQIKAGLARVKQLNSGKNDALGSLVTALTPLTTTKVTRLLVANPTENTYTIEELLRKPCLIRLSLPVAESPRIAPIIGRLVLSQFNFAVLSPKCNRSIFKLAAVDEAHNFITATVAKGMAQSRSNNGGFALALQALNQISDSNLLETIFATAGTKLVMRGIGDVDAEKFSRSFGSEELPYITYSTNAGLSDSTSQGESKAKGKEMEFSAAGAKKGSESKSTQTVSLSKAKSKSTGESASVQTRLRPLFLPSELIGLPTRYAVLVAADEKGQRWQPQIINMDSELVTKLEQSFREQREKEAAKLAKTNKDKTKIKALPAPKQQRKVSQVSSTSAPNPQKLKLLPAATIPATVAIATSSAGQREEVTNFPVWSADPLVELLEPAATIPAQVDEPDGSSSDQQAAEIKSILLDAGIKPAQIDELTTNVVNNERSASDLLLLIEEVQATPAIKHSSSVIARRIKANDYPGQLADK